MRRSNYTRQQPFKFERIMAYRLQSLLPFATFLLLLFCAADAWGCPTCKEALAGDPAAANMANGIGISILFMLSMPYLILAGLGSYFYWEIRRAQAALKRKQELAAAAALDVPPDSTAELTSDVDEEELVGVR